MLVLFPQQLIHVPAHSAKMVVSAQWALVMVCVIVFKALLVADVKVSFTQVYEIKYSHQ